MARGRRGLTRHTAELEARQVVESPEEQKLWQEYSEAKAEHGTASSTAWDAFFEWLKVALPWTP